jgi:hypothetical protein
MFVTTFITAACPTAPIRTIALLVASRMGLARRKVAVVAPDVVNELSALGGAFAPSEGSVEEPRTFVRDQLCCLQCRFGADGGAADDYVLSRERVAERLDDVEERLRVSDEDLNDLADLSHLGWRREEVRGGARSAIPDIGLKAGRTKASSGATADDAEADQADLFPGFARHAESWSKDLSRNSPEGKRMLQIAAAPTGSRAGPKSVT